jgi:hypothetical protein
LFGFDTGEKLHLLNHRPFALQLGGPFGAFVSGRIFTNRLLSVPLSGAYSSSSQPFDNFH